MVRRLVFGLVLLLVAGCGGGERPQAPTPEAPPGIELTSSAFQEAGTIPTKYTCAGADTSPPLEWAGAPQATKSYALLVDDPDAPGGTYTHWTVYGIPRSARRFPEGGVPPRSVQGENSFGDDHYGGPCPPKGDSPHRYVFALYALKAPLALEQGAKPDDVRQAIAKAALARGRLIGMFKRG